MPGIKKLLILSILIAIIWASWNFFFKTEKVSYSLTTSTVTKGDITSIVTATGELNAISVVEVGTQVSGTIQEIYVDFNSNVKAGQLIALIDPSVLQLTLNEQQATLGVYQANVQSCLASLKDSQRKLKRNQELFNRKLIARSEVDTSETDVDLKKAALQEARSRVVQAKAAVQKAKTNLNYTRITSPVNGIVIDRQVDAGQTVAASYQTPTLFKIAEDLSKMQIETKVDEADIGSVKENQNVTFRVDAFPDETFYGKVVQVRIAPSTSDSVVTYTVIIHVDNKDLKLKPGMTANVSIETAKAVNVIRLPVAALRFTPNEELISNLSFDKSILTQKKTLNSGLVWISRNNTLMPPVQVVTGVADSKWVELISEKPSAPRPPRPNRPQKSAEQNKSKSDRPDKTSGIIHENTQLVINAQLGVSQSASRTSGGLFGAPRGGGRPPR